MRVKSLVTWVAALAVGLSASIVRADTLDKELTALKEKLAKQLIVKGRKKAAALDFTDLQGRKNELGRYLAEQLTVELVGAEGISVVDRANLKSILDEHKLTEEGLVKPENAKKLGEFSGVDAIIIGTVSVAGSDIELLVKAISTDTAEVVAAGRMRFAKTPEMQQQLAKAISPMVPSGGQASSGDTSPDGTVEALPAIMTKEAGPLRIALTNVMQKKDGGVVCSFQLTNPDLQKTLRVAQNVENRGSGGDRLNSKITDYAGAEFGLRDVTGLPTVTSSYPADIARIIATGKQVKENENVHNNPSVWRGGFGSIDPGQSIRVSMEFRSDDHSELNDTFQFQSELVVGVCEPGTEQCRWKLETLMFDKVMAPKLGHPTGANAKP